MALSVTRGTNCTLKQSNCIILARNCGPCNFHAIQEQLRAVPHNCAPIPPNGIPIGIPLRLLLRLLQHPPLWWRSLRVMVTGRWKLQHQWSLWNSSLSKKLKYHELSVLLKNHLELRNFTLVSNDQHIMPNSVFST